MHALRRLEERKFSQAEVDYVIEHGAIRHGAGATWHILRECDIPFEDRDRKAIARLVGVVVCVEHGAVATVFRNDDPVRYVNRKEPYYRPRRTSPVAYLWEVAGKAA